MQIIGEPFVGLSAGALHAHLANHAARLGRRINYRVRLRSFDSVARLVEAGVGLGILPMAAAAYFGLDGVRVVPLADDWANRKLVICASTFTALSGHVRMFVNEIVEQAKRMAHDQSVESQEG